MKGLVACMTSISLYSSAAIKYVSVVRFFMHRLAVSQGYFPFACMHRPEKLWFAYIYLLFNGVTLLYSYAQFFAQIEQGYLLLPDTNSRLRFTDKCFSLFACIKMNIYFHSYQV